MTATVTSLSSRYAQTLPAEQTQQIIAEVAGRYGLDARALTGKRRTREIAFARQSAYAEVQARRPHLVLCQIGQAFGGRDHTTILHGIRAHQARMAWAEVLIAAAGVDQPDLFARAA